MKKKLFFKIPTIITGAITLLGTSLTLSPAYAYEIADSAVDPSLLPSGIEINGKRYWSVAEMQIASELINQKREEFCQGDRMCEEELSWQQMDELGGIYRALDPFENTHFMLTSVNPSRNTVKFLYHDEDKMLSRMLGETIRHDIASIYAVWVDESLGSITTTSSNWLAYGQRAPYHLGSVEEVEAATHLIFDESEAELGPGWFTPNTEREYHVVGSNLVDNTRGQIHYSLNAASGGGHSHGTLDYSGCINSPNYQEGMECRMMYHADGYYDMLPMNPSAPEENPQDPSTSQDPGNQPSQNPEDQTSQDPTPDQGGSISQDPTSGQENQTSQDSTSNPSSQNFTEDIGGSTSDQPKPASTNSSTDSVPVSSDSNNTQPTSTSSSSVYAFSENPNTPIALSVSVSTLPTRYYATSPSTNQNSETKKSSAESESEKKSCDELALSEKGNQASDSIEVPLAGDTKKDEFNFPWWIVALFIGGALFVFWWFFLPVSRRDDELQEKYRKK